MRCPVAYGTISDQKNADGDFTTITIILSRNEVEKRSIGLAQAGRTRITLRLLREDCAGSRATRVSFPESEELAILR